MRLAGGRRDPFEDSVAIERALDIRVNGRPLAVTLRTPGDDVELALGFLASEGILSSPEEVTAIESRAARDAAIAGAGGGGGGGGAGGGDAEVGG